MNLASLRKRLSGLSDETGHQTCYERQHQSNERHAPDFLDGRGFVPSLPGSAMKPRPKTAELASAEVPGDYHGTSIAKGPTVGMAGSCSEQALGMVRDRLLEWTIPSRPMAALKHRDQKRRPRTRRGGPEVKTGMACVNHEAPP
jgi:hypothetical protein